MITKIQVSAYLRTADLVTVRLSDIQAHLGVSERVLTKRLHHDGTTFGKLKNAERLRRIEEGSARTIQDIGFRAEHSFYKWRRTLGA